MSNVQDILLQVNKVLKSYHNLNVFSYFLTFNHFQVHQRSVARKKRAAELLVAARRGRDVTELAKTEHLSAMEDCTQLELLK
jgi:hypothetical protein